MAINRRTKTRKVAVWPDGRRYPLRRKNGMWEWSHTAASSHLDGVRENLALEGGWLEVEPNPHYVEPHKRRKQGPVELQRLLDKL